MRQRHIASALAAALTLTLLGAGPRVRPSLTPNDIVNAFAEDHVRSNATRMLYRISALAVANDGAEIQFAISALESALDSSDWQQRQFAAAALRRVSSHTPSDRLLAVVVEGLRDDHLPRSDDAWSPVLNATGGVSYLLEHPHEAADALVLALASDDAQQRFLCAYVLGMTGQTHALPEAAEILIDHLADNKITGDAVWAAAALYRFGPQVIPMLASARPIDEQQRGAIELVLLDLVNPPKSRRELVARKSIADLTTLYHDAAIEYVHGRVALRWQ